MPINWNQVERDEDSIDRDLAEGHITQEQARRYRRDIADDIRGAAEEDAENAYRDTMGGW
jgi:polyhydroxyalkanoate synthesis regulator phasin